jgi:hypothetical protein
MNVEQDQGKPGDNVKNRPMGEVERMVTESAQRVANMENPPVPEGGDPVLHEIEVKEKRRKPTQALTDMGAAPLTAFEELRDARIEQAREMYKRHEIDKEQYEHVKWSWKNIFKIIPEEDLGLVLMDFGLRAMIGGETMGIGGALGTAGAGALQGVSQRREAAYQRDIAALEAGEKSALAQLKEQREQRADRLETMQGIFPFDPKTGTYATEPLKDDEGNVLLPQSARPFSKEVNQQMWRSAFPGMTDQDIALATLSGMTPQTARARALTLWNSLRPPEGSSEREKRKYMVDIPGKGRIPWSEVGKDDREAWIRNEVKNFGFSEGALPPQQGGQSPAGRWDHLRGHELYMSPEDYEAQGGDPNQYDEYMRLVDQQLGE